MSVAVGLLGDVMLGRNVAAALRTRSPEKLWDPALRELTSSLDLVICNLECCLSSRGRPTVRLPGKPFFFRGPPGAVRALSAVGIGAATLANNHALDYEEIALRDTLAILSISGIACCGAGRDLRAARAGVVVNAGSSRIGLISFTDHPVQYAAADGVWGVAHANLWSQTPGWLLSAVSGLAARCDHVIVCPHWGPNMTTEPAAWQRRAGRELQAAGASLIAGHSAHVFHGVGWERGPILFDLGDALDDYRIDPVLRNDLGLLAIWRPAIALELVGLRVRHCHTALAHSADADWIATRLTSACAALDTHVQRVGEQRFIVRQQPGGVTTKRTPAAE
ncbi:MAG TPA: CapA family protein [Solirubrobacteraceae bacterium]|nr:CapA family protein [Solirubrobacteraceae bacterium]